MKSRTLLVGSLAALAATPASAVTGFSFSYDVPGLGLTSGTLYAAGAATRQSDGRDAYRITGISGTRDGASITGIVQPDQSVDQYSDRPDDLLYLTGDPLDERGIGFSYTDAGTGAAMTADIYLFNGVFYEEGSFGPGANRTTGFSATPATLPQLTFTFSYDVPGLGLTTGTLTATDYRMRQGDGRDAYVITGISGTRDGSTITGLVQPGHPVDQYYDEPDDLLYATGDPVDYQGIGFTYTDSTTGAAMTADIYLFNGVFYEEGSFGPGANRTTGLTVTPVSAPSGVPEPGSWAMLLAGFGLVGGALRTHRRAGFSPSS